MNKEMVTDCTLESAETLGTPCQEQKRLFVPCSSSKRSLFREERDSTTTTTTLSVDVDSDLGPMSPLALTDQSSCDSSPGRQFVSPLATPEKSTLIPLTNWSRMMLRYRVPVTSPVRAIAENDDEVVPETPSKELDLRRSNKEKQEEEEEEQEEQYSENRLTTPLSSLCKRSLVVPKLHRRKSSLSTSSAVVVGATAPEAGDECISPEIKKCGFKRHVDDSISFSSAKLQRTDETVLVVPRARAALFKDEHKSVIGKSIGPGFTLTPKSFYGAVGDAAEKKTRKSDLLVWREPQPHENKKRRSLPSSATATVSSTSSYNISQLHRKPAKKHRGGEINCGVWHGIKRPKPKRQVLQNCALFKSADKQNNSSLNKKIKDTKENFNPQSETMEISQSRSQVNEDFDPNRKFFKSKAKHNTVVTINDLSKPCLAVTLNEKRFDHIDTENAKLDEISFDTTDLCVDEPDIEKSLEQSNVSNILKVLEDDWEDDDYYVMETTSSEPSLNILSPKTKPDKLKSLTMSPGSELSSMTSSMNIKDVPTPLEKQVNKNNDENDYDSIEMSKKKLYPLFLKNHLSKVSDINPKKRKRNTSSWQLSSKHGCTENQYQIDAGQNMFGATQCNECGIMYHVGDPDDENAHLNYHNSFKILKFQGWKKEHVVFSDSLTSSRIILIDPKDSNLYWKKVNEVLQIVDRDLGLSDMKLAFYKDKRIYMYVRDKTILGILVAEYVKNAYRIIPEISELNCCTSETSPVKCGINVVWTSMSHRRQGIATKLVDTLRTTYYYGYIMSIEDLAFSTPTPSGKQFAEKYTKISNFKVY